MIWNAITTGNSDIAMVNGNAGYYHPDIAPFAGLKKWNNKNLEKLFESLPAGTSVFVSGDEKMKLDQGKWNVLQQMDCCQMVYEKPVGGFMTPVSTMILPLNMEHVPQMMELTALTKPGPFLEKTILFGNYFGIFIDGRLAAMTGQRMHPIPYMEVSAVCTHPDFRGEGYAKGLMLHVMKIILDNSSTPFLHVLANNTGAIQLYESIGFRTRKRLFISVIRRLG
jgi:ribosomal protein S18 acetylase RimI-like enzyme